MRSNAVHIEPYAAPEQCMVANEAAFLGLSRVRCKRLEASLDVVDALAERDVSMLTAIALVRRRSPSEVAAVCAECVELALAAGIGKHIEPALRARIDRACALARCADPDGHWAAELRDRFWALRPATDLVCVVAEMLDNVGRRARAGSAGAAERCIDRLTSLVDGELGALGGRQVRADMLALVDARLGAVTPNRAANE